MSAHIPQSPYGSPSRSQLMIAATAYVDQDESKHAEMQPFTSNPELASASGAGVASDHHLMYPASCVTQPGDDSIKQMMRIQRALNQRLGPDYISERPGPGGKKLQYLDGATVINIANEIFGFNGWSSEIVEQQLITNDRNEDGTFDIFVRATVRVTLRDGSSRMDTGQSAIDRARIRSQALERAYKESATDALKRTLRHFGNAMGNCLYDKSYSDAVRRMKKTPRTYDRSDLKEMPELLHSRGEAQPVKPYAPSSVHEPHQNSPAKAAYASTKPLYTAGAPSLKKDVSPRAPERKMMSSATVSTINTSSSPGRETFQANDAVFSKQQIYGTAYSRAGTGGQNVSSSVKATYPHDTNKSFSTANTTRSPDDVKKHTSDARAERLRQAAARQAEHKQKLVQKPQEPQVIGKREDALEQPTKRAAPIDDYGLDDTDITASQVLNLSQEASSGSGHGRRQPLVEKSITREKGEVLDDYDVNLFHTKKPKYAF